MIQVSTVQTETKFSRQQRTDYGKQLVYTLDFSQITLKSLPLVGGKNASLGELFNALRSKGIASLDGFATTADSYRALLSENDLEYELRSLLSDFDPSDVKELAIRGHAARTAVLETPLPEALRSAIASSYDMAFLPLRQRADTRIKWVTLRTFGKRNVRNTNGIGEGCRHIHCSSKTEPPLNTNERLNSVFGYTSYSTAGTVRRWRVCSACAHCPGCGAFPWR